MEMAAGHLTHVIGPDRRDRPPPAFEVVRRILFECHRANRDAGPPDALKLAELRAEQAALGLFHVGRRRHLLAEPSSETGRLMLGA